MTPDEQGMGLKAWTVKSTESPPRVEMLEDDQGIVIAECSTLQRWPLHDVFEVIAKAHNATRTIPALPSSDDVVERVQAENRQLKAEVGRLGIGCRHLLSCIDYCSESGGECGEMDPADKALIEETRREVAAIAAQVTKPGGGEEMSDKQTMTLNLTAREMAVVDQYAADFDLSKTAVIRQALRWYQLTQIRIKAGERVIFSGDEQRMIEFVGPGFQVWPPTDEEALAHQQRSNHDR